VARLLRFFSIVPVAAPLFLVSGASGQPPAPPAVVPGAGIAPTPPSASGPTPPPGAATAIQGVTPQYLDKPAAAASGRKEGWIARVSTAATMSFANNSNVVGQVDGSSFAFGLKFDGTLDLNRGKHEWRNSLGVLGAVTRTPVIDAFVKTSDNFALESIYLFHALTMFGPFARATLNTAMFRGTDVRAVKTDYFVTHLDGSITEKQATELPLTDPFKPLTLKQSVGLFVQPYQSEPITIELRGGAGAQEVLANGQLAIQPSPPPMPGKPFDPFRADVKQLQDVNQIGGELALSLWGSFVAKKLTYKANADAMTPFVHSPLPPGDGRSAFALTNVQIDGALSFHLVDWAAIDYQLKAIRQPQLVDAFQVQNTLLVTFGLTYSNAPAAPTPPAK
jgi:hypothetical protein